MKFKNQFTYFAILNLLVFALSGCSNLQNRGQFITNSELEKINSTKPTKSELVGIIGNPTYIPEFSQNTWYYIHRSFSERAWFDPFITNQRIVKVVFNKDGKLSRTELLNNTFDQDMTMNSDYTKTYGTEQSGIQKFVKNMGRFNPSTSSSQRKKKKSKGRR